MTNKLRKIANKLHPTRLTTIARGLLRDEAIGGKLIVVAAIIGLVAANTDLHGVYQSFWQTQLGLGIGNWDLSLDLRHWVSQGLMMFFFLVVGLELKRELVRGELKAKRTALLPVAAAIGGMIVPALIYLAFNFGQATASGWAIPTATDIALAIGLLALLGRRIPSSVRIFLLALAIVDDILAVVIIAVFYATGLNFILLGLAAAIALTLWLLAKTKYLNIPIFIIGGVALWLVLQASGIHPSIAGAALGLLAPIVAYGKQRSSLGERVERATIPFSTLVVVPLFALASTGIVLHFGSLTNSSDVPIAAGIILGLVAGKFIGIVGATWLMVKLKFASLPYGARWSHMLGIGALAGIGFTVSLFVTELAFTSDEFVNTAKLSILIGSLISALIGLALLRLVKPKSQASQN